MTHPTSCPGCGAPYAAACGYCGRGRDFAQEAECDRLRRQAFHRSLPPEHPDSFWRNLLASASTIGSVRL